MVRHMTKLDPGERFTAKEYLALYKGEETVGELESEGRL